MWVRHPRRTKLIALTLDWQEFSSEGVEEIGFDFDYEYARPFRSHDLQSPTSSWIVVVELKERS